MNHVLACLINPFVLLCRPYWPALAERLDELAARRAVPVPRIGVKSKELDIWAPLKIVD
jgi:hypothetical protein